MSENISTVILTRPAGRNKALRHRFSAAGYHVEAIPLLTLRRLAIVEPFPDLAQIDLVFFVSGYAVEYFFAELAARNSAWPTGQLAACVGPGTATSLQSHGVASDYICLPGQQDGFDSPGLFANLRASGVLSTLSRALIVRGSGGNPWFAEALRAQAIDVQVLDLYERQTRIWQAAEKARLSALFANETRKHIVLTSPQGVDALLWNLQVLPDLSIPDLLARTRFVVTHHRQADRLVQQWPFGSAGETHELVISEATPQDDAIFNIVTISE